MRNDGLKIHQHDKYASSQHQKLTQVRRGLSVKNINFNCAVRVWMCRATAKQHLES